MCRDTQAHTHIPPLTLQSLQQLARTPWPQQLAPPGSWRYKLTLPLSPYSSTYQLFQLDLHQQPHGPSYTHTCSSTTTQINTRHPMCCTPFQRVKHLVLLTPGNVPTCQRTGLQPRAQAQLLATKPSHVPVAGTTDPQSDCSC